jgi:hypothetical protein
MSIARSTIVKTPGLLTLNTGSANGGTPVKIFSSKPIKARLVEAIAVKTDERNGDFDETPTGRFVEIRITPTQFSAALIAKIFTQGALRKGASILPAVDEIAHIHTVDGVRRVISNCFIYNQPPMTCKAGSTILGEMVLYGYVGDGAASPDALANFWDKSAVAFPSDTGWDPDNEITPGWRGSWSLGTASAWDDIVSDGGFTIKPTATIDIDEDGSRGPVNATISNYIIEVSAKVKNISETLLLDALGFGAVKIGGSRKGHAAATRTFKLASTNADAYIHAVGAMIQSEGNDFDFTSKDTVVQSLTWKTRPNVTSGLAAAPLIVSVTDPDA